MHTLLLCDTPDSEGQAYGRSIHYPPFLRKCTLNITGCKCTQLLCRKHEFSGLEVYEALSAEWEHDCVRAERVWALIVPVPPPDSKQVVGDSWFLWFTYLLILVGGIGPFPTVINEAQGGKKRERWLYLSSVPTFQKLPSSCAQCLCSIHVFCHTSFPIPLTMVEMKVIDMSPNNKRLECLIPGLMFVFTIFSSVNTKMSSWNTFMYYLMFLWKQSTAFSQNFSDINKRVSFPQKR